MKPRVISGILFQDAGDLLRQQVRRLAWLQSDPAEANTYAEDEPPSASFINRGYLLRYDQQQDSAIAMEAHVSLQCELSRADAGIAMAHRNLTTCTLKVLQPVWATARKR